MDIKAGKVDEQSITELLAGKLGMPRPEIQTGPGYGVDVSVVALPGGMGMAMCSDPLSLLPQLGMQESAWLSLQLMVNDMATTGFAPMYGQFVLNLPAEMQAHDFKTYWHYLHEYSRKIGLSITGGHTGFIPGLNSTVSGGGTLCTIAPLDKIRISRMARQGDAILLSKSAAISSAGILALRFPGHVRRYAGKEIQEKAAAMFYNLSVLKDAQVAIGDPDKGEISAMHDVTEGGILGALYELAIASGNGVHVQLEDIPVAEAQQAVCKLFQIDPLQSIGAGAMLISCAPQAVDAVQLRMHKAGISCRKIGMLTHKDTGMQLFKESRRIPWPSPGKDPYWDAYFKADALGLT